MDLKALDLFLLTKLTSLYVDQVTCIECCKYFIAPETASCGHSLCHSCWRGRRTCPVCVSPLEKQSLKLNSHMQLLTAHIQELGEAFEQLFNIKLDEFVLDMSHTETELSADPTRNVKDWLASSQNHFPAPLRNSESSMHESNCITVSSNDVQIHDKTKKNVSSEKLIYVKQPQDDWDKIEQLPDTEEMPINKENILIPNNQILSIQDCEYTTDNPRRSSRKRDAISENTMKTQDMSFDKLNSKNSSSEIDKRSTTAKQNWNNVKRMRKEFSKLNKKNRNKLNVSIEMCKKNQQRIKSNLKETEQRVLKDIESHLYIIDDNTPVVDITTNNNNSGDILPEDNNENTLNNFNNNIKVNKNNESQICDEKINVDCNVVTDDNYENVLKTNDVSITKNKSSRMPFIKKGLLCPKQSCQNIEINGNSGVDKNIDDDIEISIKIGSTITNIIIKKKTNDIQLKINTDQEVQTSLGSFTLSDKNNFSSKNKNSKDQNDDLIIEKDKNVVDAQTLIKGNKTNAKEKSVSTKINTASAETVTAPFEITESVEKELSNIMECNESSNKKLNTHSMLCPSNSENNKTILNSRHKQATKEKVDDLDAFDGIFDIDYVEDDSVNMLGDSKLISSEILMPTDHSKKRSQAQKRDRDLSAEEVSIPEPKKIKSTVENNAPNKVPSTNNSVIADNDSINYDHVMDQVFANIDADMDKNQKKKSLDLQVSPKAVNLFQPIQDQKFDNQKFSENIFTITENETEALEVIRKDNDNNGSTQRHVENLLTPGISEDILSTNPTNLVKNVELVENQVCTPCEDNDDSDKCIVEETPQKSVKYVCALAASKWIVSYQWVEGCLTTNLVLRENPYEALDGTGEPGPKRSRLAKKKLFDGITFFCMPPFSVLDTDTLKEMLESSGGIVVSDAKSLMVNKESPSLLLAEPENTQEDRFVYLALELGIVPVNYEWALNCLGSYTLSSIHNLLLCPAAILPPITASWPAIIISQDSE
ncbi:hypothetical protein ACJJTC_011610 [Scirpophaga incertulas]